MRSDLFVSGSISPLQFRRLGTKGGEPPANHMGTPINCPKKKEIQEGGCLISGRGFEKEVVLGVHLQTVVGAVTKGRMRGASSFERGEMFVGIVD